MNLYTTILYGISLLLMLTIGSLVLAKSPKSALNQYFFGTTVSTIFWMLAMFLGFSSVPHDLPNALIYFRLAFGLSVYPLLTVGFFFYYFPRKTKSPNKTIIYTVHALAFLFFILGAFTPLIEESVHMDGDIQIDVFGPVYPAYMFFVLGLLIFTLTTVVKKIVKSRGIERRKIIVAATGFMAFALSATLTNAILPIFGIFILQTESVAFSLFFFIAVLYAIYKQRFFNMTFLTLRGLRTLIMLILFFLVLESVYMILRYSQPDLDRNLVIGITAILTFFSQRWIQQKFPDLYGPGFHQLRNALSEFNYEIFDAKTLNQVEDKLQKTFEEKLNIKDPRLYILETEGIGDELSSYREDDFTKGLAKIKDVVVLEELLLESEKCLMKEMLVENMRELRAALCVPLKSDGRMIGFLKLGEQQRKKSYSREEIDEIYKVIPSLEVVLMNILVNNSLREENDIMKEIIHARTKTLKRSNKKLEEMIEQQNNFISLTAHEFRTPLTVAMLGLEQISYTHEGKVSAEVAEDIQTSHEQLDKLTQLINRLLEMRRVDDDKVPVNLEDVDIVKLVRDTAKGMNLLAQQEEKEVSYSGPKTKKIITTDTVKLKEVFDNVIQNAIKFSKKGGKIEITLRISRKEKKAFIKIRDYGRGIRKKDQKIIFDKFQQGSQYNQGVGIGLYLCKKYMQLLKGDITVSSKLGHGSTFTVEVPL